MNLVRARGVIRMAAQHRIVLAIEWARVEPRAVKLQRLKRRDLLLGE